MKAGIRWWHTVVTYVCKVTWVTRRVSYTNRNYFPLRAPDIILESVLSSLYFSVLVFCFSLSCILSTNCCQCLWIVYAWLPLRFSSNVYLVNYLQFILSLNHDVGLISHTKTHSLDVYRKLKTFDICPTNVFLYVQRICFCVKSDQHHKLMKVAIKWWHTLVKRTFVKWYMYFVKLFMEKRHFQYHDPLENTTTDK